MLAAVAVTLHAPYIGTEDGFLRWELAYHLVEGDPAALSRIFLISKLSALLQAGALWAFGTPLAFACLQAFAFNLAIFACCGVFDRDDAAFAPRFLAASIIAASPLSIVCSMILTDSVWPFVGIAATSVALFAAPASSGGKALRLVALALAATLLLGSRANALATLPVLAVLVLMRGPDWRRRILDLAAIGLGVVGGYMLPGLIFGLPRYNPLALSLAWEIVGVAKQAGTAGPMHLLDPFGSGPEAFARYHPRFLNAIFYDGDPPLPADIIVDPRNAGPIASAFLQAVIAHPVDYARVKLELWAGILGVRPPLLDVAYGLRTFHLSSADAEAFVPSVADRNFRAFQALGNSPYSLARTPWVLLLTGLGFVGGRFARVRSLAAGDLRVLAALFYYASFLVAAQAMEFRYFAPAYFTLACVLVGALSASIGPWLRRSARTMRIK